MKNTIASAIRQILKTNIPFVGQLQGANENGFRDLLFKELTKTSDSYKKEYPVSSGRIDIAKTKNSSAYKCIELGHYSLNQGRPCIEKYIRDAYKRLKSKQCIGGICLVGMVTFIRNVPNNIVPANYKFIEKYIGETYDDVKTNCENAKRRYSQIDNLFERFKDCFDDETILIKQIRTVNGIEIEMNFIISEVIKNNTPTDLINYVRTNEIPINKKAACYSDFLSK